MELKHLMNSLDKDSSNQRKRGCTSRLAIFPERRPYQFHQDMSENNRFGGSNSRSENWYPCHCGWSWSR
ncbi:hypothetical protein DPEC_G00279330 [Dallia pectoralis]|uniref:Uncharacterized protein n=1 Tax=Dallia pectoralis TaxID=75939 RepID=A0ACC2FME9_DALPE|nr:hypothetical protein DPEC_G00279330 [Dallia pectoralis]